ncbi:sulfotransferase [Sphingomonas lutea]|uniref:Sulfotransferase n=1 Tax=Sphingomonas lutea TaxID=1045317 RepID=A0A7G9SEZ1_9SPHN|nr:sulfotransferase [Sphingomonas lutea]QNN66416.1 sulfotransferase [Sphingomonas lutea]
MRDDPQHRLAAPAFLSRALEAAWRAGALSRPALDKTALIRTATARERGELQDGAWEARLALLTADLERHADLNALGRTIAHGQLVGLLRQRIAAERLWRERPEIGEVDIRAPVIILGHMRSGTTRLHRLLSADRRFAHTRLHETLSPMARSPRRAIARAIGVQALLSACNPELRRIHPSSPRAAEEEFGLHAVSLHGAMFEAQWHVPNFARFCEQADRSWVYAEFRRVLQTLRWRRKDPVERVQLLKAPQFMADLDTVLSTFPDARILYVRRDPAEVVASTASLVWNQRRVQSNAADRAAIGQEWLRRSRLRESAAKASLARHPHVPILHVDYGDVSRNWRSEIARIYDFLGYPQPRGAIRRMAAVATASSHHGHHYSLEQFGLSEARVA